jgi:hypothetical protein
VTLVDDLAARAAVGQARVGEDPTSSRAIRSIGRCVAESPIRTGGRSQSVARPLEREREVRAALVPRGGVDLVDDHGARAAQRGAAPLGVSIR